MTVRHITTTKLTILNTQCVDKSLNFEDFENFPPEKHNSVALCTSKRKFFHLVLLVLLKIQNGYLYTLGLPSSHARISRWIKRSANQLVSTKSF